MVDTREIHQRPLLGRIAKLEAENRELRTAAREYIAAHAGIRARFQDAELADEYTRAGRALDNLLITPGCHSICSAELHVGGCPNGLKPTPPKPADEEED